MATCGLCKQSTDSTHVKNNYMRRYAGKPYCASPAQPTVTTNNNPAPSKFCQAKTKSGTRCRNLARKAGFCHKHQ